MNIYKRDTYSEFRDNSYRYYVHTMPIERKLANPPREEWEPDREQLERKYFARLQGHQGVGSFIGILMRCLVWVVLFPFYVLRYVAHQMALRIRRAGSAVKQAFLPYYLKAVFSYRQFKVAYARGRLSLHFWREQLRERVRSWLYQRFVRPVIHFKTWFWSKWSPIGNWISQMRQNVMRWKNRWSPIARLLRVSQRFADHLLGWYLQVIGTKVSYIKTQYYSSSEGIKAGATRLYKSWTRWRKMQWSCLVIWLGVLAKYTMRVLEDWKVEVKEVCNNKLLNNYKP